MAFTDMNIDKTRRSQTICFFSLIFTFACSQLLKNVSPVMAPAPRISTLLNAQGATPKYAYGMLCAKPTNFPPGSPMKSNAADLLNMALRSVCMLKATQPVHPIVIILHGWPASAAALFLTAGADRVIETDWDPTPYIFLEPGVGGSKETTGYQATMYYKLLFWNLTEYAEMLIFDGDIRWFDESPDYVFGDPKTADVGIVGTWEWRPREWAYSFNCHLFLMKPSAQRFENLLERAKNRAWRPYTNTEQDILNSEFERDFGLFIPGEKDSHGGWGFRPAADSRDHGNRMGIVRLPKHEHGNPYFWDWRTIPNCNINFTD
jgi:hypothetical protein